MSKDVEIYFSDLNPNAQKELLEAFGIQSECEANWDIFPIATLTSMQRLEESDGNQDCGQDMSM